MIQMFLVPKLFLGNGRNLQDIVLFPTTHFKVLSSPIRNDKKKYMESEFMNVDKMRKDSVWGFYQHHRNNM